MSEPGSTARPPSVERVSFDDIVHTGPGTLAGRYLRSVWQPVYHAADIGPGRAKPLRVLGEAFTIYRGADGAPHLVDPTCPHRGMQLSAGFVEGDALRCFYHGWKFGSDGRCLEQPAEESRFAAKIRIASYPVREYLGLVFAYLGEGSPPEFQRYPEFERFEGLLEVDSYLRECNFFQNLENSLDQSHIGFVHGAGASSFGNVLGRALKAEESEWGLTYTYTREDGQAFVVEFGMPNVVNLATLPTDPEIGFQEALHWWVPIDDLTHVQFSVRRAPVAGEAARRVKARREARRRTVDLPHQRVAEEILRGRLQMADVDPTRCDMVRLQDDIAQVGQRRIAARHLEHRGASDVGVVAGRRIWQRELAAFAEGRGRKAWRRPAGMRPSVWGMTTEPVRDAATPEAAGVEPVIVDMRPFVEVDVQIRAFGAPVP